MPRLPDKTDSDTKLESAKTKFKPGTQKNREKHSVFAEPE